MMRNRTISNIPRLHFNIWCELSNWDAKAIESSPNSPYLQVIQPMGWFEYIKSKINMIVYNIKNHTNIRIKTTRLKKS